MTESQRKLVEKYALALKTPRESGSVQQEEIALKGVCPECAGEIIFFSGEKQKYCRACATLVSERDVREGKLSDKAKTQLPADRYYELCEKAGIETTMQEKERAAALGCIPACLELGEYYYDQEEYTKSRRYFGPAKAAGDPDGIAGDLYAKICNEMDHQDPVKWDTEGWLKALNAIPGDKLRRNGGPEFWNRWREKCRELNSPAKKREREADSLYQRAMSKSFTGNVKETLEKAAELGSQEARDTLNRIAARLKCRYDINGLCTNRDAFYAQACPRRGDDQILCSWYSKRG